MLFTFLDAVGLRKLPKVMGYTIKAMRNQQMGTMNQLQNLHLPCLQNNVQIEDGEEEKWVRAM